MTHILPDQSPPKGRGLRKRGGLTVPLDEGRGQCYETPKSPSRSEVRNYERWRSGWVKELLRGDK